MGIQKICYALTVLFISFFSFASIASGQDIGDTQDGLASWYGARYHGRPTSSGETYNRHKLTAAHNELPLGSKVKVTNKATGESVVVKINDRGPFRGARIIDLSEAAARKIHYRSKGIADVTVEVVSLPEAFLARRVKMATPEPKVQTEVMAKALPAVLKGVPVAKATEVVVNKPAAPTLPKPHVFVIQAGAFRNYKNAQTQLENLRRIYQKMPIALVEETVHGKQVHRILAGRFVSKATAEQARKDIVKKGFKGQVRELAEPPVWASAI